MVSRLQVICLGLGMLSTVLGCAIAPPTIPPPAPPPAVAPPATPPPAAVPSAVAPLPYVPPPTHTGIRRPDSYQPSPYEAFR